MREREIFCCSEIDNFSSSLSAFLSPSPSPSQSYSHLIFFQVSSQFQIFKKLSHEPVQTHMPSDGTPVQLTLLSCPDNTPTGEEESNDVSEYMNLTGLFSSCTFI